MRSILFIVVFAIVALSVNYAQQCFPIGFVVKGEPFAANSLNTSTACVTNNAPGNVVDVNHNDQFNFIFDAQLGTMDGVSSPVVTHQTGYTPPANPISSADFTAFKDANNPSKFRIQFNPLTTHQIAVNDTICVDFTFNALGAGTHPVNFHSSVAGFGQNVPAATITVQ